MIFGQRKDIGVKRIELGMIKGKIDLLFEPSYLSTPNYIRNPFNDALWIAVHNQAIDPKIIYEMYWKFATKLRNRENRILGNV